MHLSEIQTAEAVDTSHYFPDTEQSYLYLGTCLAGEVGEICNVIKKYARGSITEDDLLVHLLNEMPDVLIYLVMLAEAGQIDLESAYHDKKEYNEHRYRSVTEAE